MCVLKDFKDLVDFRIAGEQGLTLEGHLGKNASYRPHIDCCGVMTRAKKDFRCAVPQSNYLGAVVKRGE